METRRLDPAAVTPLGLFHCELCRQRTLLLEAEHRDDRNRSDRPERYRFRFRAKEQRVTSIVVRLANLYRSGRKQIDLTNLFREAVQSIRGDGSAGVILPRLEDAFELHKDFVCAVADGAVPSLSYAEQRRATLRLQEYLPVANAAPVEPDGLLVVNEFQRQILDALDGCALPKQGLAEKVCGGEGTRLYRKGGLKELRKAGKVLHQSRLGYYRPDAPPLKNVVN